MPLIRPVINLNGTSAEAHIEARMEARKAVRILMGAMSELRPHGRDYPGQEDRYKADTETHKARFRSLDTLYNELEDEAVAINEAR